LSVDTKAKTLALIPPYERQVSAGTFSQLSTLNIQLSTHSTPMLIDLEEQRRQSRFRLWRETRERLLESLQRRIPGHRIWLFGSITQPGRFNAVSDIDLALEQEPTGYTYHGLGSWLEQDLGRPVDVLLLSKTRLREKILAEGEPWTLSV
jgi:predicted nucleotidyltransferase